MPGYNDNIVPKVFAEQSDGIEPVFQKEYVRKLNDELMKETMSSDKLKEEYLEQAKELQNFKESDLDILNEIQKMIVSDKKTLEIPCEPVSDIKEGEEIAAKLFRILTFINKTKILSGSGLSANQIGINKRVCVINIKEPLYLINPTIVDASGECNYFEGCLSFPGDGVKTKRFTTFTVKADNLESELFFDIAHLTNGQDYYFNQDVFEAMCVQHEIDHLNGITMYDRKLKPLKAIQKIGRNDRVTITDGTEFLTIKFKNFDIYEKKGFHILPTV